MSSQHSLIKARPGFRLGLDENGLGPRLGPLIVTAVCAELNEAGAVRFARRLPQSIRKDLNDSKALVSSHNYSLAEAWARALSFRMTGIEPSCPNDVLAAISAESVRALQLLCPKSTRAQCWGTDTEQFISNEEQRIRIDRHLSKLEQLGMNIRAVRSELVCTGKLNALKEQGIHRFSADLHAMEHLILTLGAEAGAKVEAVCGKVGGIGKYEPFFGPLAGRLHTAIEEGQARSSYYFPQLGTIHFVRDADASDPFVMMASLVGKYLRELLMARISSFYADQVEEKYRRPSGYHDPITTEFVAQTKKARRRLGIIQDCFERRAAD